ncbi:hypothetical protein [Kribbella sp. NPDC050459]|uniref:hypothetical protein n=1 Tax=Kribbella sp. NPDC050459 TaxID=3155785 RepID=UPI003401CAFD
MTKLAESVRETADEYRQGANRPLGGYAVALTSFAGADYLQLICAKLQQSAEG